jgi:aryl-alcohol dehydrogenase-like predicted oxidoreductase
MRNEDVFRLASNKKNTIIDSRSAFIQGLILMKEENIPPFLTKAKPIVKKINELTEKYNISKIALALNYVKQTKEISDLVFGVDNIKQLKENINFFETDIDKEIMNDIAVEFKNIEADIVMPSLWKK